MFGWIKEKEAMAVKQYADKLLRQVMQERIGELISDGSVSPKEAYKMGQIEMRDRIFNRIEYFCKTEENEIELGQKNEQ